MGLLSRIGDVLRANINEIISKAEDPEKMLNAAIEEMQKQLIEAKSRVAMAIADEKRLLKKYELEREKADEWEKKAMSAVRASRDELAVEALGRKKEHLAAAQLFEDQLGSQKTAVDELKRALTALTSKLEDTKRKRTILMARAKRAEAQRHIASTLHAANETSAAERLERLEARVERAEAEAEATWEVAALTDGGLERDEFALLDEPSANEDLLALKARMRDQGLLGSGAPKKALPAPAEVEDDDEDPELAASLPPVEAEEDDDFVTAKS
jgi:phage shock protein A